MTLQVLQEWFEARLLDPPKAWYSQALAEVGRAGVDSEAFRIAWSGCGRRLGRSPLAISREEVGGLNTAGVPFVPQGWGTDEAGRALMLLVASAATREPASVLAAVDDLFRLGEMREQQAILRVLQYLPDPRRYMALAADAVRVNVLSVLEALACENPFPAAYLPELAFNQMVMKAVFNGVALARIVGLADRNNDELRRIVHDFSAERRAAGRPVPADLDLILAA